VVAISHAAPDHAAHPHQLKYMPMLSFHNMAMNNVNCCKQSNCKIKDAAQNGELHD
jgi:hypothetical protein